MYSFFLLAAMEATATTNLNRNLADPVCTPWLPTPGKEGEETRNCPVDGIPTIETRSTNSSSDSSSSSDPKAEKGSSDSSSVFASFVLAAVLVMSF